LYYRYNSVFESIVTPHHGQGTTNIFAYLILVAYKQATEHHVAIRVPAQVGLVIILSPGLDDGRSRTSE
jgi:hypothetical protein